MNVYFFNILGIEPTKDARSIKRAYARKAKEVHPEESPEKFQLIRNAYEQCLSYAKSNSFFIVEEPTLIYRYESENKVFSFETPQKVIKESKASVLKPLQDHPNYNEGRLDFHEVVQLRRLEADWDGIYTLIKEKMRGKDSMIHEILNPFLRSDMKETWVIHDENMALWFLECIWWNVENRPRSKIDVHELKRWFELLSATYPHDSKVVKLVKGIEQRLEVQRIDGQDETIHSYKNVIDKSMHKAIKTKNCDLNKEFSSCELETWLRVSADLACHFLECTQYFVSVIRKKHHLENYHDSVVVLKTYVDIVATSHDAELSILNQANDIKNSLDEILLITNPIIAKKAKNKNSKKAISPENIRVIMVMLIVVFTLMTIVQIRLKENRRNTYQPPVSVQTDYIGQGIQLGITSSKSMDLLGAVKLKSCFDSNDYSECSSLIEETLFHTAAEVYNVEPFEIRGYYSENIRTILKGSAEDFMVEILLGERKSEYAQSILKEYSEILTVEEIKENVFGWREEEIRIYLEDLVENRYPSFDQYIDSLQ